MLSSVQDRHQHRPVTDLPAAPSRNQGEGERPPLDIYLNAELFSYTGYWISLGSSQLITYLPSFRI
jgi:hypothetical protein